MKTDLIKDLYFRELERKQEFDAAPTVPIAVLTLAAGLFAFYVRCFSWRMPSLNIVFIVLLALAFILAVLAVVWIIRSYLGAIYEYLPYAGDLLSHYENLVDYFGEPKDADDDFESLLRSRMVQATTANQYNNNRRSELLFATKRFVAALVIVAVIAAIPPAVEWLTRSEMEVTSVQRGK